MKQVIKKMVYREPGSQLRKGEILTLLFLLAVVFVFLRSCTTSEQSTTGKNTLYEGLTRNEILAKCISCHPDEHQNEKIGPHGLAFTALLNHRREVNDPAYTEKPYSHYVNEAFEQKCVTCHAPVNLFEEHYKGVELFASLDSISYQRFPGVYSAPKARVDSSSWISGIDCLSCHFTKNHVIAGAGFVEKSENRKMKDYCFPLASVFLSSDMFCASCHMDPFNDLSKNISAGFVSSNTTCNSCHQEYQGAKGTHYYYWRHDAEHKRSSMYNDLLVKDMQVSLKKGNLAITWLNTGIPHEIGKCRDYVTLFEVKDASGKTIATKQMRFNRKEDHAKDMAVQFVNYALPGTAGYEFNPFSDTIREVITLPKNFKEPLTITASVLNKAQYWFPDSTGLPMTFKTFTVTTAKNSVEKLPAVN